MIKTKGVLHITIPVSDLARAKDSELLLSREVTLGAAGDSGDHA